MENFEREFGILGAARTIAVYGLSATSGKPAHDIPLYMQGAGYTVVGVNPMNGDFVDGIRCYRSLVDVEEHIDILNVFRRSADAELVIPEAIARRTKSGDIQAVWLQSGIVTERGQALCTEAGIDYIEDTCIYVLHRYFRQR